MNIDHIVSIPVTKSLSVQLEDIIGELRIDEQFADQIAAWSERNVEIRLDTSIQRKNGQWKLRLVSITGIPMQSKLPGEVP